MTEALRRFCQNWIAKADSYNDNSLADEFDKFTSLYVVFNALYMEVMTVLVQAGRNLPRNFRDRTAATEYVIQHLGSRYFITNLLNDQQSLNDLAGICRLIQRQRFNIILDWGVPQRQLDLDLLANLQSPGNRNKSIAILELFYYLRCNMFHGHKGFENRQRELLGPVNRLLRKVVLMTHHSLT